MMLMTAKIRELLRNSRFGDYAYIGARSDTSIVCSFWLMTGPAASFAIN